MPSFSPSNARSVALVSMPWPLFNQPSIQLGTLKAWLGRRFPDLRVEARHFYLEAARAAGYETYGAVSRRSRLAEALYAPLAFPSRLEAAERLFLEQVPGKGALQGRTFREIVEKLRRATDAFIDSLEWEGLLLAGVSISLCQLTSSLYFIRRIKERFPRLPVVTGGSTFSGPSAGGLLERFPGVDGVVTGEGEIPLERLTGFLLENGPQPPSSWPPIPGLVTRPEIPHGQGPSSPRPEIRFPGSGDAGAPFRQLPDLSVLPPPDYDDYFDLLGSFPPSQRFFPVLPAEISRGCWWRSSKGGKDRPGCAFCNLNLQWEGYRVKKPEQAVEEVRSLTSRHKCLAVSYMDNAVPPRESKAVFQGLAASGMDLSLFAEIRADTPRAVLESMRQAGLGEAQVGVEALSTRLLRKMNKGTTAIRNLQMMKWCEELGVRNASNLMIHFPGSDEEDVAETLENLEFARPFHPLKIVRFWLGSGSPAARNPGRFGIRAAFNHPFYQAVLPREWVRSMPLMVQSYRGDLQRQRKLWSPVRKRVEQWRKEYEALRRDPFEGPVLSYGDGGDFLVVRHRRAGAEPVSHRLEGASREIYLYCVRHRGLPSILRRFSRFSAEQVTGFLDSMVDKKLMFREGDRYLSLAARRKGGYEFVARKG